jgi:hypothetical protein
VTSIEQPGRDLYFCPSAEEVESATHGGFDQCCGKAELHVPLPDSPGAHALSELLSRRQRETCAAQGQTDDELREQYVAAVERLRDTGGLYSVEDAERDRIAEAVLRVRDRRMEQLSAGRATWKAKAEEIERDRDRLAAEVERLRAGEAS